MLNRDHEKLIAAIRGGKIRDRNDAAERFGVSTATIWRRIGQLRAAGYVIATQGVGKWVLLQEPRA